MFGFCSFRKKAKNSECTSVSKSREPTIAHELAPENMEQNDYVALAEKSTIAYRIELENMRWIDCPRQNSHFEAPHESSMIEFLNRTDGKGNIWRKGVAFTDKFGTITTTYISVKDPW